MMRAFLGLLPLMLVVGPASALATQRIELKPKEPGAVGFELSGEYRFLGLFLSDFAVDAEGTRIGQPAVAEQRLRARFDLQARRFRIGTEWDLFSGQIFGETWDIPGSIDARHREKYSAFSLDGFVPRRAAASLSWPSTVVEFGLVTSHWGLGMLANDGAHEPFFGRGEFGDRVVRLRATSRPLYALPAHPKREFLSVTAALDWVVADDTARFRDRQLALQWVGAVLWNEPGVRAAGLYGVFRAQVELDDGRWTDVGVIDAYLDRTLPLLPGGATLRLAAEGALIWGATNRSTSYNERGALRVTSGGLTGVLTLAAPSSVAALHLRGGWASADPSPDDGWSNDFSFDRDFDVGMVLFDQVGGGVEAAAHALITDPERSGQPPDGIAAIATEGAFRRALFVQPIGEFRPLPWLTAKAGVLLAMASGPVQHPFYGHRAGGVPRNQYNGEPDGPGLGVEFDWSLAAGTPILPKREGSPRLEAMLQGGHLRMGEAMRAPEGCGEACAPESAHQVIVGARFRW